MSNPDEPFTDDELADAAGRVMRGEKVAGDPRLVAAVDRQQRVVEAIRSIEADAVAPASLHTHVRAQTEKSRRSYRWRWPAIGGVVAATAAAVLVALLLATGPSSPRVTEVAELGSRPPSAPASAPDATVPATLRLEEGGVPFPNYAAKFGWRAVGSRTDSAGERGTTTAFYERGRGRVAYTIVEGDPIALGTEGQTVTREGGRFTTFDPGDGRRGVTWTRQGRTCVITSGVSVSEDEILTLASWRAKGAIPL